MIAAIIKLINSDWFQILLSSSGWIIAFLVSTKYGIKILSFFKHIFYTIKNPPIIYSINYNFIFLNADYGQISEIMKNIYNDSSLEQYKLSRAGIKNNYCKLHYPGVDYIIEICSNNDEIMLNIKINETEANYNNINNHIKKIIIKKFGKEVVQNQILKVFNTTQFKAIYQLNLKFTESQNNYFIKERFAKIPKGYVSDCLLTVKDKSDDSFLLSANLKEIKITSRGNFDKFIDMIGKYSSIV